MSRYISNIASSAIVFDSAITLTDGQAIKYDFVKLGSQNYHSMLNDDSAKNRIMLSYTSSLTVTAENEDWEVSISGVYNPGFNRVVIKNIGSNTYSLELNGQVLGQHTFTSPITFSRFSGGAGGIAIKDIEFLDNDVITSAYPIDESTGTSILPAVGSANFSISGATPVRNEFTLTNDSWDSATANSIPNNGLSNNYDDTGGGSGGSGTTYSLSDPLDHIDTIWLYGASIFQAVGSSFFEGAMSRALSAAAGRTITVVGKGVGGQDLAEIHSRWESEKGNITGQTNIMLAIHCMGNTISSARPYSGLSTSQKNGIQTELESFIQSIQENGQMVFPVNTTFRNYGGNYACIDDESIGSLPFNTNILLPALNNALSSEMVADDGLPFCDLYPIGYNHVTTVFADDVHYVSNGYQLIRNLLIKNISERLLGTRTPTRVTKYSDPLRMPESFPEPFLSLFATSSTNPSQTILGATENPEVDEVLQSLGYRPSQIKRVTVTGNNFSIGDNGTALAAADKSISVTNDAIRRWYLYGTHTSFNEVRKFGGFYPGQQVVVALSAFRDTTSTAITDISFDGVNAVGQLEANNSASNHTLLTDTNADSNGEISIYVRRGAGSSYWYLNGISMTPNIQNITPTARLNSNQSAVAAGASFTLDASQSVDLDGFISNYEIVQTEGDTVTISNGVDDSHRNIVAPSKSYSQTLSFSLVVTDNNGIQSVADTESVDVQAVVSQSSVTISNDSIPDGTYLTEINYGGVCVYSGNVSFSSGLAALTVTGVDSGTEFYGHVIHSTSPVSERKGTWIEGVTE